MTPEEHEEVEAANQMVIDAFSEAIDFYVTDPELADKIRQHAGLSIMLKAFSWIEDAKKKLEDEEKPVDRAGSLDDNPPNISEGLPYPGDNQTELDF